MPLSRAEIDSLVDRVTSEERALNALTVAALRGISAEQVTESVDAAEQAEG